LTRVLGWLALSAMIFAALTTAHEFTPEGRQAAVAELVKEGKLKRCPECGEAVQPSAKKCRFCGHPL
jgi:hypothetical protein